MQNAFDVKCDVLPEVPKQDPLWVDRPWFKRLKQVADLGMNTLMVGGAGSGKTCAAQEIAARRSVPFLRISLENVSNVREGLVGSRQIVAGPEGTKTVFVEGQLIGLSESKEGGVVLLDEINLVDPQKEALLHELLDQRSILVKEALGGKGRVVKIGMGVQFFAAANPTSGAFSGTQRLNAALVDRMAVIVVPPLNGSEITDIMAGWGVKKGTAIGSALTQFFVGAEQLSRKQGLRVQVSLRAMRRVVELLRSGFTVEEALTMGFVNASMALADNVGAEAIKGVVKAHFTKDMLESTAQI